MLKELTRLTISKPLVFLCGIQSRSDHTDIDFVVLLDSISLIPITTSLYHHIRESHQFYYLNVFLKPLTSPVPPWGNFWSVSLYLPRTNWLIWWSSKSLNLPLSRCVVDVWPLLAFIFLFYFTLFYCEREVECTWGKGERDRG